MSLPPPGLTKLLICQRRLLGFKKPSRQQEDLGILWPLGDNVPVLAAAGFGPSSMYGHTLYSGLRQNPP